MESLSVLLALGAGGLATTAEIHGKLPREHEELRPPVTAILLPVLNDNCMVSTGRKDENEVCIPAEACEVLRLSCGGEVTEVRSPRDLEGHVEIRTASEALAYVRFFTSSSTSYLLKGHYVEIFPRERSECIAFCLLPSRWEELGLETAKSHLRGQGRFEISRTVVRQPEGTSRPELLRITEVVSSNGEIILTEMTPIQINKFDEAQLMFPGVF